MDWIKRNLIFVIGAVVTLVLMGLAGWYSYSGWANSSEQTQKLTDAYGELNRLKNLNPSPGDGKVDNIKLAKEQQKEMQDFMAKLGRNLQRIPSLPPGTNIAGKDYSDALLGTISQLQKEATNNSVILPPKFLFSFSAQAGRVTFASGSLGPLAVQLGEVKAICEVLNEAKINYLDAIRRERVWVGDVVSADDANGPATDYLDQRSVTNELAVITPYEITFRCFTPELAGVIAGFARSPYGFIVKAINSEPAAQTAAEVAAAPVTYYQPVAPVQPQPVTRMIGEDGPVGGRYGGGGFGGYRPPPPAAAAQPMVVAPTARPGLQPFLKEKQIKITMLIHVVKLLPQN